MMMLGEMFTVLILLLCDVLAPWAEAQVSIKAVQRTRTRRAVRVYLYDTKS
jgi:lipopolysaccharide export LptBFGC system permease protein LptF